MKIYRLRISIMGIPNVYRIIEASENSTFDELHEAIFDAFDRYDPHLYTFFMTRKDSKNIREIYNAPEIAHSMDVEDIMGFGKKKKKSTDRTRIGDVDLNENDVFHYLFDFGDDWWHRIRVEKITEAGSNKKRMTVTKSVGNSPPQYPEDDEDDPDDDDTDDELWG